jgi:hypothetical protein
VNIVLNKQKIINLSENIINDGKSLQDLYIENIQDITKNTLSKYINYQISQNTIDSLISELKINLNEYDNSVYYCNNNIKIIVKPAPYYLNNIELDILLQ